ncbi:phage tail assembly chaperone family protein, TAC [Pseudomonas aeruginosa]|uniref:phage tail assembly chaperone family protein, TAC n=1 Tax=Pseudomonas aeruginosa TaxID=287 RepID=UPI0015F0A2AB|nr:phage tail assembly chaperone family protein, TAC [Pseudomonas aeruginosa]MBA5012053.1 phage tail assembly chaperone family protein, TAC [Pseudomonas aeruginosa]
MNLNELRAAGGFIESALVRKEITWTRVPAGRKKAVSDTFQVFVRRNSFGAVERLFSAEGDQQSRNARYLAECIRLGETGEESLTYEQAYDLDPALGFLLLQALGEVNRVEDAEKN